MLDPRLVLYARCVRALHVLDFRLVTRCPSYNGPRICLDRRAERLLCGGTIIVCSPPCRVELSVLLLWREELGHVEGEGTSGAQSGGKQGGTS